MGYTLPRSYSIDNITNITIYPILSTDLKLCLFTFPFYTYSHSVSMTRLFYLEIYYSIYSYIFCFYKNLNIIIDIPSFSNGFVIIKTRIGILRTRWHRPISWNKFRVLEVLKFVQLFGECQFLFIQQYTKCNFVKIIK